MYIMDYSDGSLIRNATAEEVDRYLEYYELDDESTTGAIVGSYISDDPAIADRTVYLMEIG